MNIENKKQVATILLAVGLGLVAVFLTSQYIQSRIKEETTVLAKEYTKQGAALQKELELTKRDLGKIVQAQEILAKQIREQPRVVVQEQPAPKPVEPAVPTFSLVIPPGKRALTLQIDSLLASGGLITAGDFVDILAYLSVPEGEESPGAAHEVITVLFQNLQVLAVGTNFKPAGTPEVYGAQQARALNVTLAVTPEEAGLLSFAQTKGRFQFSLRPPSDRGREVIQTASWNELAEYVLDQQGTELRTPKEKKKKEELEEKPEGPKVEEILEGPPIRIFRGGREL